MASAGVKVGGGVESKGFGTAVAGFSFRAPRISIFARAAGVSFSCAIGFFFRAPQTSFLFVRARRRRWG